MINVSRRRFFGLMAAPAVIGISGRMSMWTPLPISIQPQKLIISPPLEDFSTDILRITVRERFIESKFDWRAVYGTPGR